MVAMVGCCFGLMNTPRGKGREGKGSDEDCSEEEGGERRAEQKIARSVFTEA